MNVLTKSKSNYFGSEMLDPVEDFMDVRYVPMEDTPRLFRSLFVDLCHLSSGLCIDGAEN